MPVLAEDFWKQLRIIPDAHASYTPEEAWQQTQSNGAIALHQANQVVASANSPPHWAGFTIRIEQFAGHDLWLSLKSPTQDQSQVWVRVDDFPWQNWADLQERGHGHYLFPVWVLPRPIHQKIDVLVRLQGVNRMQFPLDLQAAPVFMRQHALLMLLIGSVLAVPLLLVMYAVSLMQRLKSPLLGLFVLMALSEILCASWISGLLCFLLPTLKRADAALIGSFSYWVLFVASIHHARVFLSTSLHHPQIDKALRMGAWFWCAVLPLCFVLQPAWVRSLLLMGGSVHVCVMMLLAYRSWRRQPSMQLALFASMWFVYVTSVLMYWLYRWFEWPLLTTLGIQFLQGALMASLMGWSACLQVIQQRMDLQQRVSISQARHRWYAAAQHDLWQPLQSIQLFARALLKVSPEKRPGLVAALQLASQSVDDYMHHLRYWADEEKPLHPSTMQLHLMSADELLQPLMEEFSALAHMRHVVLRYAPCHSKVHVHILSVHRMVRNLLANALQFTPAGGRVLLGCKRQGPLLWLLCLDNGSGMNSIQAQSCFNAFTRLKHDDEGALHLGLGLFSVKLLAQQHQMPTRLHSVEGRGTVVGFGMRLA